MFAFYHPDLLVLSILQARTRNPFIQPHPLTITTGPPLRQLLRHTLQRLRLRTCTWLPRPLLGRIHIRVRVGLSLVIQRVTLIVDYLLEQHVIRISRGVYDRLCAGCECNFRRRCAEEFGIDVYAFVGIVVPPDAEQISLGHFYGLSVVVLVYCLADFALETGYESVFHAVCLVSKDDTSIA